MKKYIVDINTFEHYQVGTKARNLFLLKKNNINIPDFFCIPSNFFENYLAQFTQLIQDRLNNIDYCNEMSLDNASIYLKSIISEIEFENEFEKEILNYLEAKFAQNTRFSVRSSSSAEDGQDISFAGQFDTYLNVSQEDIFDKIKKCAASLFSSNVLKYCHNKNIKISDLKMSVIVQEMINSKTSGIAFTANPRGLLNEMVVVVGEGVGELIVEDKVPTTTYYYNNSDKNYYFEKQEDSLILSKESFIEIVKVINSIKAKFGEYLDIEFAFLDEKLFILQVRQITTLKINNTIIFDNSNIVESYPNITLPLTASFVKQAYYGVFLGLSKRILSNKTLVHKYEHILKEMVESLNGRMYYNINNWYTLINHLPFSSKIIPIWQEMLGISNKSYQTEKIHISMYQKVRTYMSIVINFLSVPKGMDKLNKRYIKISNYFKENYKPDLDNMSLMELYNGIYERVLKNWDITLLNDLYAFIHTGLIKHMFKKTAVKNYEAAANKYISGITNIESIKPVRMLIEITMEALKENIIEDLKKIKSNETLEKYLNENPSKFAESIKQYIDIYGDRSLEELKLESKTFRANPISLVEKVLEYANDMKRLLEVSQSMIRLENSNSGEILKDCTWFEKNVINYFSKKAIKGIKNREISRLNRSRIYGMVRTIFMTIGENLYKSDMIGDRDDIFYLKINEIFDYISGQKIDFKSLIETRKQEYRMYRRLPNNNRLVFANQVFQKKHTNINAEVMYENDNQILGTPCSNGIVTGEVIVIDNPSEVKDFKDKILVTKMTDPGWVFLITLAKGIIAEKGSLLSHTAIISRELNIPSIVGAKNVTNILRTGDIIKMNGNTGEIYIEKRSAENV